MVTDVIHRARTLSVAGVFGLGEAGSVCNMGRMDTGARDHRRRGRLSDSRPLNLAGLFPGTLAGYVPRLRNAVDDILRMRIVLHEFGLLWEATARNERLCLVEVAPDAISPPWDAFLAAYVEYRCYHDGLVAPDWVFAHDRYLDGFWFPFPAEWKDYRLEAIVHAPAAFEAHGALVAERDLLVV